MRATDGRSAQNLSHDFWSANQGAVNLAVRIVVRRHRLNGQDSDDLRSEVWLKLLSSPTASTQFRGDSGLTTYVASIARRVLLDTRNKHLGKWRPTARARCGGPGVIEFDRLVRRDGVPKNQAVEILKVRGVRLQPADIDSVCGHETRRTVPVEPEFLATLPSVEPPPDQSLAREESRHIASAAILALAHALTNLTPSDRALLLRRVVRGETVANIAQGNFKLQKQLYRRIDKILLELRSALQAAGVSGDQLKGVLVGDLTNLECGCGFQNSPIRSV